MALNRAEQVSVRLVRVGVDAENFDVALAVVVIAFVVRQREVIKVSAGAQRQVVIAKTRPETVAAGSRSVGSGVRENIFVEELSNVGIDGRRVTIGAGGRVVVVAHGEDEIGSPAFHKRGHVQFIGCARTVITDDADNRGAIKMRGGRKQRELATKGTPPQTHGLKAG